MPQDPGAYRCPKCGATAALLIPEPIVREDYVTLKCLQCAHLQEVPRRQVEGAGGRFDSTQSSE